MRLRPQVLLSISSLKTLYKCQGEDYNWHYIGNVRVLTSSVDGLRRVHAERSEGYWTRQQGLRVTNQ